MLSPICVAGGGASGVSIVVFIDRSVFAGTLASKCMTLRDTHVTCVEEVAYFA